MSDWLAAQRAAGLDRATQHCETRRPPMTTLLTFAEIAREIALLWLLPLAWLTAAVYMQTSRYWPAFAAGSCWLAALAILAGCTPVSDAPDAARVDSSGADVATSEIGSCTPWRPIRDTQPPVDRPRSVCELDRQDQDTCPGDWLVVPFRELQAGDWFTTGPDHSYAHVALADGGAVSVCYEVENGGVPDGIRGDGSGSVWYPADPDLPVVPLDLAGDWEARPATTVTP